MTESTGSGSGGGSEWKPEPEPEAETQDPFAALFREKPQVDPNAQTNLIRPPLEWGPAKAQPPWARGQEEPAAAEPAPQQVPDGRYRGGMPPREFVQGGSAQDGSEQGGFAQGGGAQGGFAQQGQSGQQSQPWVAQDQTGINPVVRPQFDDDGDEGWSPYGQAGSGSGPESAPRKSKKKAVLVTGGSLGVVGILALVGVLLTQNGGITASLSGSSSPKPTPTPTTGFAPTGNGTTEDVAQTAQAFFTAWAAGDLQKAANYTDDPVDALAALHAYQTDLNATGVSLTPTAATVAATTAPTGAPSAGASTAPAPSASTTGPAAASGVQNFSVSAAVTAVAAPGAASTGSSTTGATGSASSGATPTTSATAGASIPPVAATWTYSSSLTAYAKSGRWYVKWDPSVLAPNLTATEHLATVQVAPGAGEVTDADGNNMAGSGDAGIQSIVSYLKSHVPPGSGTPGVAVELVDASGTAVSGTADTIKAPVNAAAIATTIDPHIESLAETAVQRRSGSSLVVVRPSTGAILAVANNDGGRDDALGSREAPGSTMKIITATALFNFGVLTPSSGDACPATETIQGVTYHNSGTDVEPSGTPFLIDFAQSCNNAFTSEYTNLENLRLESTAVNSYGLNQPWNIGLGPSSYFAMPTDSGDESGSELAQEAFGQGKVSASPLSMASVAATVDTGSFHQPYLISSITNKVTATPLPSSTQSYLKQVMRAVIANPVGTAYGIPFGSSVYGKTGTAEHGPVNMSPNAWFTAVDPGQDVAACALVLDNTLNEDNYGATNAAPEVLTVFKGL